SLPLGAWGQAFQPDLRTQRRRTRMILNNHPVLLRGSGSRQTIRPRRRCPVDETFHTHNAEFTRSLPEKLARTLRHEVGDFLQKLYASVAILQSRLPPEWDLERDILARLHHRAEQCKELLDAVQDFLCPIYLNPQRIDLGN